MELSFPYIFLSSFLVLPVLFTVYFCPSLSGCLHLYFSFPEPPDLTSIQICIEHLLRRLAWYEGEGLREVVSDICLLTFLWWAAHHLSRQPKLVSEVAFFQLPTPNRIFTPFSMVPRLHRTHLFLQKEILLFLYKAAMCLFWKCVMNNIDHWVTSAVMVEANRALGVQKRLLT